MEQLETLKKMMQTNKMAFDYNFSMMMSTYEQNKLLLYTYLNQTGDIPEEAKRAIENWLQVYRTGCDDFKKMADESFSLVEKSLSSFK